MTSKDNVEFGKIVTALDHHTKKLERRGMTLVASLLRIAKFDLQMRINGISEEEVDTLSFALHAVERGKTPRGEHSPRLLRQTDVQDR